MTNEELFDDLKQFIDARFSQEMAHVATKDDLERFATKDDLKLLATKEDLKDTEDRLGKKIDQVQDDIAETLTKAVEAVDTTKKVEELDEDVKTHERRLTRLEHRAV